MQSSVNIFHIEGPRLQHSSNMVTVIST